VKVLLCGFLASLLPSWEPPELHRHPRAAGAAAGVPGVAAAAPGAVAGAGAGPLVAAGADGHPHQE